MHRHATEVLRAGLSVKLHQVIRIELIGLPCRYYVFESELRRVAVGLDVVLILPAALYIHVARVPVAVLGGGLRTPVSPDAELGVAVPIRHAVCFQGFARAREGTLRYLDA